MTDDDGETSEVTRTIQVQSAPVASPIEFAGSAAAQASTSAPRVSLPPAGSVAAGDRLVMALSLNSTVRTYSPPTGVTGWTLLDDVVAGDMRTVVWTKIAGAGDAGARVTVPLNGSAKHTLTVAAYRGVDATPALAFAGAADTANHAQRVTPSIAAPEGAWLISYWADKSSTTTSWTSASSTSRAECLRSRLRPDLQPVLGLGCSRVSRHPTRSNGLDERPVQQGDDLVDRAGACRVTLLGDPAW